MEQLMLRQLPAIALAGVGLPAPFTPARAISSWAHQGSHPKVPIAHKIAIRRQRQRVPLPGAVSQPVGHRHHMPRLATLRRGDRLAPVDRACCRCPRSLDVALPASVPNPIRRRHRQDGCRDSQRATKQTCPYRIEKCHHHRRTWIRRATGPVPSRVRAAVSKGASPRVTLSGAAAPCTA